MAGFFLEIWDIRRSLFFVAIVISLSVGLSYFSQGFGTFLSVVALFGIGAPLISVGCPKAIALWFHGKDRGTAIGVCLTGPRFGGAFALAATNTVIMPFTGYKLAADFRLLWHDGSFNCFILVASGQGCRKKRGFREVRDKARFLDTY